VVFGKAAGFAAELDLSALDGVTNGFRLDGEKTFSGSGASVASAGDMNGDGLDDIIIGAPLTDTNGTYSGAGYVVFGGGLASSALTTATNNALLSIVDLVDTSDDPREVVAGHATAGSNRVTSTAGEADAALLTAGAQIGDLDPAPLDVESGP
jgi:hypothetical protein